MLLLLFFQFLNHFRSTDFSILLHIQFLSYPCLSIVEMLIQTSTEFSIDLNAKSNNGQTAFYNACFLGQKTIVEMLIDNAKSFKLDLMTRNNDGLTGFQIAEKCGYDFIVHMIKRRMPNNAVALLEGDPPIPLKIWNVVVKMLKV